MFYSDWKEMKVNVTEVLLDYDNPRVFIDEPTQDNLLRFLVDEYEAIELASQININKGLPPAEKPVITLEDGNYIVLESNRRVSACKILVNPTLLTENEANKMPKIDKEMRNYLKNFPVVLAPDRDSAEAFITMRHSGEKGTKRWSTIAATKRFVNRHRKGESVKHIARVLGETPADVRKGIRFFLFLEFVRNEIEWTGFEKEKLEIYRMETTKLDRFLPFSRRAKEVLKIDFNPDQTITTTLPIDKFKAAVKIIIRRIYLDNESHNTRSSIDDVFDAEIIEICGIASTDNAGEGPAGGAGEGPAGGAGERPAGGAGEGPAGGAGERPAGGAGEGPAGGAGEGATGGTGEGPAGGVGEGPAGGAGEGATGGAGEGATGGSGAGPTGGAEEGPTGDTREGSRDSNGGAGRRSATGTDQYVYLTSAHPFFNTYQKNNRINTLLRELRGSKYKENRMGTMYLIRALLETYTHEYVDHFVKDENREYRIRGVTRERTKRTQKLRELLFNNIKNHLKEFYPQFEEEIELLEITFTENNNTAATRIINFYIHSQTQVPDYHELLDAWKKVSIIIRCLDEILCLRTY